MCLCVCVCECLCVCVSECNVEMESPTRTVISSLSFSKHNTQAGVKQLLKGTAEIIKKFKFCW